MHSQQGSAQSTEPKETPSGQCEVEGSFHEGCNPMPNSGLEKFPFPKPSSSEKQPCKMAASGHGGDLCCKGNSPCLVRLPAPI
jgi:hypothetical protein